MSANLFLKAPERKILETATVGIAGAGGIGSNCAMHLVRAGVRRFVLADFDVVSASNLNRQFFFRDQIGRKKVEALAENLQRIEPGLDMELQAVRLDPSNLARIFGSCDIVAEAFDHADEKAMLLSVLRPCKIPIVAVSGIAGFGHSAEIGIHVLDSQLIFIGDGTRGVDAEQSPASPRVGIAAAMQANTIIAKLLKIAL